MVALPSVVALPRPLPVPSFADIHDDMNLAEDYVKFVVRYVLEECAEDIKFFNDHVDTEKVRARWQRGRSAIGSGERRLPPLSAVWWCA